MYVCLYVSMYIILYLSQIWSKSITILKEKIPVAVPDVTVSFHFRAFFSIYPLTGTKQ